MNSSTLLTQESSPEVNGGKIFNIQRYSLHDGSGIRTVVFFKGCPLKCPWCANPESRSHKTTFMRRESRCIECAECTMDIDECPSGAWEQVGNDMTLEQVIAKISKDDVFFGTSNGGVTLSGGEILSQPKFAIALLERLKSLGYHTAIEISGYGSSRHIQRMGQLCNQVLFDFKIMDSYKSKQLLGLNLDKALQSFTALVKTGCKVIPRLPLIPGFTLDIINVDRILTFLEPYEVEEIHLLPFHQYGANKYQTLGLEYQLQNVPVPSKSEIETIKCHIESKGFRVIIGG